MPVTQLHYEIRLTHSQGLRHTEYKIPSRMNQTLNVINLSDEIWSVTERY